MRDKFRVNSLIVVPAAIIVLGIYIFQGLSITAPTQVQTIEWIKVIPYIVVLGTAVAGMNVMLVLIIGILTSGIIGITTGSIDVFDWFGAMGTGITGMGELIIITLLAGGMLETIRYNGGIDFIIRKLTLHVNGKRGAELSIAALVSIANLCTANNTIAIITTGPIAKDIAQKFHLDRRKTASILDTFSCLIQGIIPYGAQIRISQYLSYQYHRQSLLSVYNGSLRPARYLIPLSETVFIKKKNRNICQSKEKPYLCARYYELVA